MGLLAAEGEGRACCGLRVASCGFGFWVHIVSCIVHRMSPDSAKLYLS